MLLFFMDSGVIAAIVPADEFLSVQTVETVTMEVVSLESESQFGRQADLLNRYIL
jgi:hypothetical protein